MNVDPDGVYRAYRVGGSVAGAVHLSADDIETYLRALADAGELDQVRMDAERAAFDDSDSSSVADVDLLGPAESVKPRGKLALLAETANITPRDALQARQDLPECPSNLCCNENPRRCLQVHPIWHLHLQWGDLRGSWSSILPVLRQRVHLLEQGSL